MWDSPQNPVRFDWESCLYNNSGDYFHLESDVQLNSIYITKSQEYASNNEFEILRVTGTCLYNIKWSRM